MQIAAVQPSPKHVVLGAREQAERVEPPFQVSRLPDDTLWTEFYRVGEDYLLRFPNLADFEVSADGQRITSQAVPGVDVATVEHLYHNQVLPLALSKAGKCVFHASAVEVGTTAVAFLAESGRGKSTLAAAFATTNHRFLTDDGLILEPTETGFLVNPSHPSIRLWEDSRTRLVDMDEPTAAPVSYTTKLRILARSQIAHCDVPRPLRAAYFLGPGKVCDISANPLTPSQALIEWARHVFLLDIEDKSLLSRNFDRLASLANTTPCFVLDYPRNFDDLPNVLTAIVDHVSRLESAQ